MADMLVKLYDVRPDHALTARLAAQGITIKRALAPDLRRVVRFVESNAGEHWPDESGEGWSGECEAAMTNHPPTCFVAVQHRVLVGFACYDATAKGFFGPTGVLLDVRRKGIGTALLLASLLAMWDDGYGYAAIGWPAADAVEFYANTVQATVIEGSSPGIYGRMIGG
jgi:GNAT superfamily N-acetyltransferase